MSNKEVLAYRIAVVLHEVAHVGQEIGVNDRFRSASESPQDYAERLRATAFEMLRAADDLDESACLRFATVERCENIDDETETIAVVNDLPMEWVGGRVAVVNVEK